MKRVILVPAAHEDLLSIVVYIATESQQNADRVTDRIDKKLRGLARLPNSGRPRPELGPRVRSVTAYRFVVFYRNDRDAVRVLRVLHGAQDISGEKFK